MSFCTDKNFLCKVLLAGQYQSHCRQYTIRHIAEDLILSQQELHGIDYNPESVFILTDGKNYTHHTLALL